MELLMISLMVVPLVFAGVIAFRPAGVSRVWALGGTGLTLLLAAALLGQFFSSPPLPGTYAATASWAWLPQLGLELSVGMDAISAMLVGLTALLGPICVLGSWTSIGDRQRLFYGWLMILQTAMYGVFLAQDLIVFYVSFEFTLLPMFILIREFGSTNRRHASIKFFLYTFTGSLIALAGLIYVAIRVSQAGNLPANEAFTLDIFTITTSAAEALTPWEQGMVLIALLAGFAVKVPLFPVHTWLPLAHTEAPTAGSVILAGVLLKLGTYAMYRLILPITPYAAYEYAPVIGVLAVIGVVYAGLICWIQTDIKKLVAYSSVSHLGFCVLGLFALNATGMTGSVLYMLNHGLSTGALFLLIGFMYERYHTRDMREIGGLASKMPVWSTFMVFFTMASVGLPGLNGFISEFLCMMSAFQADASWGGGPTLEGGTAAREQVGATWGNLGPWFSFAAATGVIVAAIYLLTMVAKVVWGQLREPDGHDAATAHPILPNDLNSREIFTLTPLAVLCVAFGIFPTQLLIKPIEPAINAQVSAVQRGFIDTPRLDQPIQIETDSPIIENETAEVDR